jgi:hypothetical protein
VEVERAEVSADRLLLERLLVPLQELHLPAHNLRRRGAREDRLRTVHAREDRHLAEGLVDCLHAAGI